MPAATRNATARSRQCNPTRVRRCLRIFFGHLFSNLGLFALVVGYVLLGALLFEFLEAGYELEQRGHIQRYREDCLKELWLITERLNVLYEKNWTHLVHEQLRKFETDVVEATKMQGYDGKELLDADRQWSFSGALLYSVTVVTTIGYGNLAPKTPEGKVVTMLYALVGVPLMLLCLSNLGTVLAGTFQFAYSHACCNACAKNQHQRQKLTEVDHNQHCQHQCKSVNQGPQFINTYEKAKTVSELPKKVAPPVVPSVHISVVGRGPRIQSRPRAAARPLTPEVRKILTECAEYSLAQASDPAAAKLLQELQQQDPEVGNVNGTDDDAEKEEEDDDEEEEEDDDDDEDEEEDLEDGEQERSATAQDTPSRVPLIWRSPGDQHRPPTPPPRCPELDSSSTTPEGARVPVSLVLLVLAGYICLGATVFAAWEEWSFLDGAYFCFITLSTIGFGDLVPGKSFQRADTQNGQLQLVACCAYLLLGLVLIAMSFTLVQEEVLAKCRQIALSIGILKRTDPR